MKYLSSLPFAGTILITLLAIACSSGDESTRRPDPAQMFARLDLDRDGRISWDEFRDVPVRSGTAEERFQAMDSDSDGYVSREEFLEARPPRDGNRRGGRGGFGGGQR